MPESVNEDVLHWPMPHGKVPLGSEQLGGILFLTNQRICLPFDRRSQSERVDLVSELLVFINS